MPDGEKGKAADREKKAEHLSPIQLTSLPLAGYNLLSEPASVLTLPSVQCEEQPVFKTLQGLTRERS